MSYMTWNEFKQRVDESLDDQGISKDSEIWYIDITFPSSVNTPEVGIDESSGLVITA